MYELEKTLREYLETTSTGASGVLEILGVFGKLKAGQQIVGGKVIQGTIKTQTLFAVLREEKEVGSGKILNLQTGKKDIPSVSLENEAGIFVQTTIAIEKGDKLVF